MFFGLHRSAPPTTTHLTCDEVWQWPVRRVQLRTDYLVYDNYPSGYTTFSGDVCFAGGASSGTKMATVKTWKELLPLIEDSAEDPVAWMVPGFTVLIICR